MTYFWHLVIFFEIYLLVAASLNLLVGYAGLLHVAHAAYFGIGAYSVALLTSNHGWGFLPALCAAAAVGAGLSIAVSLPSWRFRGEPFVLMSLAMQIGATAAMLNWVSLTGGPFGIAAIPRPAIAGSSFATASGMAGLYLVVTAIVCVLLAALQRSPFGRNLRAMRDDETAARSLGINTRLLKIQVFAVASAVAALSGGLYAAYMTFIDPWSFDVHVSILLLSMVIVGGTGNIRGPIIGAAVMVAVPELLRLAHLPDPLAARLQLLAFGLLLVILMLWRPQGLAGSYRFE